MFSLSSVKNKVPLNFISLHRATEASFNLKLYQILLTSSIYRLVSWHLISKSIFKCIILFIYMINKRKFHLHCFLLCFKLIFGGILFLHKYTHKKKTSKILFLFLEQNNATLSCAFKTSFNRVSNFRFFWNKSKTNICIQVVFWGR